jgi:hypothetical protein
MRSVKKVIIQDEDLAKVGVALRRAAAQARKLAEQTRTPLIIYERGRLVRKKVWRDKQR